MNISHFRTCIGSRHAAFLLLGACLIHSAPAVAATIDWFGATSDWASPANWGTGAGPVPGAADIAQFLSSAGKAQPSLTAEHSVSGLVFKTSTWTIGGAPNVLRIGASGITLPNADAMSPALNCNIRADADQNWYSRPGVSSLTVNGTLSGTGRVTITGHLVTITNNNSAFTGGVTLNAYVGTGCGLVSSHSNSLGTGIFKISKGWYSGPTTAPTELWGDFSYATALDAIFYGPVAIKSRIITSWNIYKLNFLGPITGPLTGTEALRLKFNNSSGNSTLGTTNAFAGPLIADNGIVTLSSSNTLTRELVSLNGCTLNVNSSGNSFGKGIKVYSGTLNVAADGNLGTSGTVRVYSGKIVVNGTNNFGASQQVLIGDTPGAMSILSLTANTLPPSITSDTSWVLAIDKATGYNALSSLFGLGTTYLGCSSVSSTLTNITLAAGSGNTYRLGGGSASVTLTINSLLSGNNNVEVGKNGGGDYYAGSVILATNNAFTGSITVNRDSILRGNAQASGGGSPFGSDTNAVTLNRGTLSLNYGSTTPASRQAVTNGSLTVNGAGVIQLTGSSTSVANLSFDSITLNPSYKSCLTLDATTANLGVREFLYLRNGAPTTIPGAPIDMVDTHYRSRDGYFLKYDATSGFTKQTTEVELNTPAGANNISKVSISGDTTLTGTVTVYAHSQRNNGDVLNGGAGKLIVTSGGITCWKGSGNSALIQVPVQFGPDNGLVEGVLFGTASTSAYITYFKGDVIGSGLTKCGPGNVSVSATGSSNKQHLGLTNTISVLEGTLTLEALGTGASDAAIDRLPFVTNIVLNGGSLEFINYGTMNSPIQVGPNGGTLTGEGGSAGTCVVAGKVSGSGLLRMTTGTGVINWNGVGNDYSGGSHLNGKITVAANSCLGVGDVRMAGDTTTLLGPNNIASTARVYQAGGTLDFRYVGTAEIGSLAGAAGAINLGPGTGSGATTLKLGGNNDSTAYYGTIQNKDTANKRGGALEKAGTGTLTLWGANTYTGTTTVAAGTLLVNWSLSGAGGQTVTCASGATLGGIGRIERPVTINNDSSLAPGDDDVGTLTVSNLYLAASSTTAIEIGATSNDKVAVIGDLTLGGNLAINPLPGSTLGTYELMTYTGAYATSGTPTVSAPPGFKGTLTVDTTNKRVLLGLSNSSGGTILLFR